MLKELEDYNWFPGILRKFQVEFIGSLVKWFGFYNPIVLLVKNLLQIKKIYNIIDLCSGSGAPAIYLQQKLGNGFVTTLTDKFPQKKANLNYVQQSVDVLKLSPKSNTLYTMYNSFHHFSDDEQQQILQNFSTGNASILIIELLTPTIFTFFNVILSSTFGQLLLTPFIRPFSFWRLFFTYVIPINIFTVAYDGIISVIKSKSVKQYELLTSKISITNCIIEVLSFNQWQGKIICIKVHPSNGE